MHINNKAIFLLFIIIVIEGYVVLSTELLAIRLTIPFIGSGTDTISIIIAAVLMPLAFGYYYGGQFKPYRKNNGELVSIRKKLISNIKISLFFLVFSISYIPLKLFFSFLISLGIEIRLVHISLYSIVFLVIPVFLLGQTIPLVSNYFSKETLSQITGKMLFFSTVGSFLGAIFSTLVLMATIGVHYTAALNFILLACLYFMLERKFNQKKSMPILIFMLIGIFINTQPVMQSQNIVENNKYNTIIVFDDKEEQRRILSLNHNISSAIGQNEEVLEYAKFIRKNFITKIPETALPKNILVVGAGGFTISLDDFKNQYDYIDIDGSLKRVSEKYFLKKELDSNVTFYPKPARAYLSSTDKKYDIIILDTFTGGTSTPEHLVTLEFFKQVNDTLNDDGLLLINSVTEANFKSAFSRNFHSTLQFVFPYVNRQIIQEYNGWDKNDNLRYNILYSAHKHTGTKQQIYTDNLNRIFYDKPLN